MARNIYQNPYTRSISGSHRSSRVGWVGFRGGCARDCRGDWARCRWLRAGRQLQARGELQSEHPSETGGVLAGASARAARRRRPGASERRAPLTRVALPRGGRPARSPRRSPDYHRAVEPRARTHPRQTKWNLTIRFLEKTSSKLLVHLKLIN